MAKDPDRTRPKRDPRVLLGFVTAITYAAIMGGKVAVWGLEDKTHIPLILAPLLVIGCGLIFHRWLVKHREREAEARRVAGADIGKMIRRCRKCGTVLDGVPARPVNIDGLNVVRVVCPGCGRVAE